ncbi:MAG: hypothetical protein U5L10_03315 [Candidatus Moranbacteria bacterium]|nr:hypothetical protein [Candidatus Moranbacteria bacterium]
MDILHEEVERGLADCKEVKAKVVLEVLDFLEKEEISEAQERAILLLICDMIKEEDQVFLDFFGKNGSREGAFENYSTV